MGKTYVDTVKYLIKASVEIDGIVEKPDIVGAIFGQTEGLLGDELDLRELQKNGRIGRIEVELSVRGGKSLGTILIPSSLDMAETSILAASLEIVDRVGPCEAKITATKIEDNRNIKRKTVLERAKQLLRIMVQEEMPESKELSELVRDEVKVAEIGSYGDDKLPCGPAIKESSAIIVCEGRADVVNLLRNGIKNCIAIGGAKVGPTIIKLCKQKEVTVFLDGDRGGDIILRELTAQTEIDFVARAPVGKEVEELARKEIITCLRRAVPVEQAVGISDMKFKEVVAPKYERKESEPSERKEQRWGGESRREHGHETERHERHHVPVISNTPAMSASAPVTPSAIVSDAAQPAVESAGDVPFKEEIKPIESENVPINNEQSMFLGQLKTLEGSLKARLLNEKDEVVVEVPIREIMKAVQEASNIKVIILDGIITQRLVDLAEQKGISVIVGIRAGNLTRRPASLKVILMAE